MLGEEIGSAPETNIKAPGSGCYILRIMQNNYQHYALKVMVYR